MKVSSYTFVSKSKILARARILCSHFPSLVNSLKESYSFLHKMAEYTEIFALVNAAVATTMATTSWLDQASLTTDNKRGKRRKECGPRKKRRKFDHVGAYNCLRRDYLSANALFVGVAFELQFRVSLSRFESIFSNFANQPCGSFFFNKQLCGSTPEARVLLPLKTLAYGVAATAFVDYFQMSANLARKCCDKFDECMECFEETYLRAPDAQDLRQIDRLHKATHGVNGMYGSLDCMHTYWKNCPVAWQGTFKGKEKKCTIILEAVCDYNLYFWHVFYGCAGTFNDINVLRLSNLTNSLIDGSFHSEEQKSGVVPYKIGGESFDEMFMLVDGIYPCYSRFVKGVSDPTTQKEKRHTAWQESARKDIERALPLQVHRLTHSSA